MRAILQNTCQVFLEGVRIRASVRSVSPARTPRPQRCGVRMDGRGHSHKPRKPEHSRGFSWWRGIDPGSPVTTSTSLRRGVNLGGAFGTGQTGVLRYFCTFSVTLKPILKQTGYFFLSAFTTASLRPIPNKIRNKKGGGRWGASLLPPVPHPQLQPGPPTPAQLVRSCRV